MSLARTAPKLRVAIIGGGMGGLVLGLCLKKYAPGVHFDIYESAAELTEVGAGIGMSPRIWTIMRDLGLEDELLTIAGTQDREGTGIPFSIFKGDEGRLIDVIQFKQVHTFHRSILQKLLARHLDAGDRIHFSKRLASYSEVSPTEPITLSFRDGTTATCDLVVGSDGIRSAVRHTMFNDLADDAENSGQAEEAARLRTMVDPVFSGQVAYRGLAPASALSEELLLYAQMGPRILVGKNRDMVIYPVSGGKFVNVLAVKYNPGAGPVYDGPWSEPTTVEVIAKVFEGWEPRALGLIQAVQDPFCWAMHTAPELPTYVNGRAALVGDAAHAMLPHQGAGVGQAFEDGYILATILAHPSVTLPNLPTALTVYDDVRRPFSQKIQQGSDRNGMNYQLRRNGWEAVSEADSRAGWYPPKLLGMLAEELRNQMGWIYEASILDERARVEETLVGLFPRSRLAYDRTRQLWYVTY
uniref:Mannitol 1-phosphate dehydrogenase n=1 Tax=Ganoderma boninense TaxID=34458 RepID=A0A5K1JXA4_9APHY|nr:Mannitol 1-phosphate dehydrogenase [Ganoderma boninense]